MMKENIMLPVLLVLLYVSASSSNSFFGDGEVAFNVTLGTLGEYGQEVGGSYSTSFVIEDMQLPYDGVLRTFNVRLGDSADNSSMDTTIYLQAWRLVRDQTYTLTRSSKLENIKSGTMQKNVNWHAAKGDYIGLSCDGYCPVLRGPYDSEYMLRISMSGVNKRYDKYIIHNFDDHPLRARLAVEVVLEVDGPPPESTTLKATSASEISDSNSGTKTNGGGNGGVAATTTLKSISDPQAQADPTADIGLWWMLIAAAILIVLLAVALVAVGACSWNQERSSMKKELIRSRPTSMISDNGAHHSNFSTIARNNPGLHHVNEMEVDQRAQRAANRQAVVVSVTPQSQRAVPHLSQTIVTFDNGASNMDSPSPTPPPPPPLTMPPDQL